MGIHPRIEGISGWHGQAQQAEDNREGRLGERVLGIVELKPHINQCFPPPHICTKPHTHSVEVLFSGLKIDKAISDCQGG